MKVSELAEILTRLDQNSEVCIKVSNHGDNMLRKYDSVTFFVNKNTGVYIDNGSVYEPAIIIDVEDNVCNYIKRR